MKVLLFFSVLFFSALQPIQAQDNVAEIAHAFIKAVRTNDIKNIEPRYLDLSAAYAVLPKESTGMNARQKNDTYIKPLYERFTAEFEKIQEQIQDENINPRKIDLVSYKMQEVKLNENSIRGGEIEPQAMVLYFNYNKKEHALPISVVEIDERWYILEILYSQDLFK